MYGPHSTGSLKNGPPFIERRAISRPSRLIRLITLYAVGFLGIGALTEVDRAPGQEATGSSHDLVSPAHFVGSEVCASCHAAEHGEWVTSQHHAAMQEATDKTVLGDFNGATFAKDDVETTFFKKDGKFWVRTDSTDGKLADFEVRYTFGIAPLQQYLIELPAGRLQALGIAWDARPKEAGGQRWYSLYPNRKLIAGDPLHWTGIDQNWNYQCAWCHATNLQKNYDREAATFNTSWSEIGVGCEACHGPASKHLEWAKSNGSLTYDHAGFAFSFDERKGVTWPMGPNGQAERSTSRTTRKEIEACAGCHARREQFSSDPKDIALLFDAFRPTTLDTGAYYPDGQQHDEVYTYGSFVQSRMYAAGVTCSDCHNPHSGKLRLSGNAVCGQCHAPGRFDTAAHHHHPAASKGSLCASCHMPTTTYMGVDPRHDHSIRIPRPDRSIVLGTPNACGSCHGDKPAAWARDAIKAWYPSSNAGAQNFAEAFDLGDRAAPGAQAALLKIASSEGSPAIARASALARLARFPSPQALDIGAKSLKSNDPEVRSAAVGVIAGTDAATRRSLLLPLLHDASRLIRMDAARALAGEEDNLAREDQAALQRALTEYIESQLFNAERPESQANLGALYRDQGKYADAKVAFRKALALDPTFVPASVSLADLVRIEGDEAAAEKILREALASNPDSPPVQHALGLSLIRQRHAVDALEWLTKAASNAPANSRFGYVLAVALHDTGKPADAVKALQTVLSNHPYDRETLMALTSYEVELGDLTSALRHAELLNRLEPERTDIAGLLTLLKERLRQSQP